MNHFLRYGMIGLATLFGLAVTAEAFEGRVSLSMKSGSGKEQVIRYAMKDGLVRMEPEGDGRHEVAMIFNPAKQEMTLLIPEQRMYMVTSLDGSSASGPVGARETSQTNLEKTGETEEILGYEAEQFIVSDGREKIEMWITDELGSFMGISGGNPLTGMMGGRQSQSEEAAQWEKALKGKSGAFPLLVIGRDENGQETFRMEAKKIEPASLPDNLFSPPSGFQKLSLPGMPGMPGMPGRQ